jgi:glycosyltransferase involved in cell wall biosynthesis
LKKKVAFIISDIDRSLAFEWIVNYIDKKQFEISFILLNSGNSHLEKFLIQQQIPVYHVLCRGKKDWVRVWFQLWNILRMQAFDVVHCHLFTASILGLTAAKMAGIKNRIYTRHHSDFHFRYFPKGVKWDRMCNHLATKIIAPSKAVISVLTDREKVAPSKISLIHHGFDLEYFKNVPVEVKEMVSLQYNPHKQYPVIGIISRFTELKGIQFIIPAFKKLLSQYPNALLLLFNAQGDYKQNIERMLQELPQQNYLTITFEPELAAVYSLFDVFIQASTDTTIESFGQTYIEALVSGVPSVFTLAGVAGEFIVDGKNALVVPFNDSDAIFEKINILLENKDLRNHLILEGEKSIKELFSIEKMVTKYSELYKN